MDDAIDYKEKAIEYFATEVALDDIGIYPKAVTSSGITTERTEWQNGWNACSDAIQTKSIAILKWLENAPKDAIDLLLEDKLEVTVNAGEVSLLVICGDTFVYGCSDAQPITCEEIPSFKGLLNSGKHGQYRWLSIKRNEKPLREIIKWMKDAGEWDDELEALPDNACNKVIPKW